MIDVVDHQFHQMLRFVFVVYVFVDDDVEIVGFCFDVTSRSR